MTRTFNTIGGSQVKTNSCSSLSDHNIGMLEFYILCYVVKVAMRNADYFMQYKWRVNPSEFQVYRIPRNLEFNRSRYILHEALLQLQCFARFIRSWSTHGKDAINECYERNTKIGHGMHDIKA